MDLILNYDEGDDDSDLDVETAAESRQMCMICTKSVKQYKCPRCSILTCSLMCCKQHKVDAGCSGRRDRSSYVAIQEYKEKNLRNDYHFLEDVLQIKESANRTLINSFGGANPPKHTKREENFDHSDILTGKNKSQLDASTPKGVKRLIKAASSRNIKLLIMSTGMSKRKLNSSFFQQKMDRIHWRVNIVFIMSTNFTPQDLFKPQLDGSNEINVWKEALVGVTLSSIAETTTISEIIALFFDPRPENTLQRHALRSLRIQREHIRCLIQRIPSPSNAPIFMEVPLEFRLREALSGKTIIEYPTLFVGTALDTAKLKCFVDSSPSAVGGGEEAKEAAEASAAKRQRTHSTAHISTGDAAMKELPGSHSAIVAMSSAMITADNSVAKLPLEELPLKAADAVKSVSIAAMESGVGVDGKLDPVDDDDMVEDDDDDEGDDVASGKMDFDQPVATAALTNELNDSGDDEDDIDEEDEEFLTALQEFETADIDTLKAFIANESK